MTWERVAQIGDALGGLATFAGFLYAVFTISRWRRETRGTKRGEAAALVLRDLVLANKALISWLGGVAFFLIHYKGDPQQGLVLARIASDSGDWKSAEEQVRAMGASVASSAAYLSSGEVEPAWSIERLFREVRFRVKALTMERLGPEASAAIAAELLAACEATKQQAYEVEAQALRLLGPIARLEPKWVTWVREAPLERTSGVLVVVALFGAILAIVLP